MHKGNGDFVYNSQKIETIQMSNNWMDQQYANINGILVSTQMNQPLIHIAYLCVKNKANKGAFHRILSQAVKQFGNGKVVKSIVIHSICVHNWGGEACRKQGWQITGAFGNLKEHRIFISSLTIYTT